MQPMAAPVATSATPLAAAALAATVATAAVAAIAASVSAATVPTPAVTATLTTTAVAAAIAATSLPAALPATSLRFFRDRNAGRLRADLGGCPRSLHTDTRWFPGPHRLRPRQREGLEPAARRHVVDRAL
jgi:hypothetical protein